MQWVDLTALIIGLCLSVIIIVRFRQKRWDTSRYAYPVLLASFPLYYGVFALIAFDMWALLAEGIAAIPFFILAYAGFKYPRRLALLVGLGCILHGIYDLFHHVLFVNPGTPTGWVAFCGSIDLVVGVYLLLHMNSIGPMRESR